MNLIAAAPIWLIAVLVIGLLAGAIEDALRLRISNITSGAVAFAALAAMVIVGLTPALWQNFGLFALTLLLGTLAFSAGLLGGGDVKLLAAISLWVDFGAGWWLLSAIFLAGGLVALGYLVAAFARGAAVKSARQRRIPYGVAIAFGACIAVFLYRDAPAAPHHGVSAGSLEHAGAPR